MAAPISSIPLPSPVSTTGDAWNCWEIFREQWIDYEVASGLKEKDAAVRVATLRTAMGRDCRQTLKQLELSEDDSKEPDAILESLERYFKPLRNVIYESFMFNSRTQQPGETTRQFVEERQRLAETCDFDGLHDRLIRDRLVVGCSDYALRA